jgi:hypothetical protein
MFENYKPLLQHTLRLEILIVGPHNSLKALDTSNHFADIRLLASSKPNHKNGQLGLLAMALCDLSHQLH